MREEHVPLPVPERDETASTAHRAPEEAPLHDIAMNASPKTREKPATPGLSTTVWHLSLMLRPYLPALLLALLLLVGLALVNMAVPACIGLLFNHVFPDKLWWVLWSILPGILLVYILRNVLYLSTKFPSSPQALPVVAGA